MRVVEAWLKDLRAVLKDEPTVVNDVRIGVFYTAVQLISGHHDVRSSRFGISCGSTSRIPSSSQRLRA